MSLSRPAYAAAVLGGLVWVGRWLLDPLVGDGTSGVLHWAGVACFAVALAAAGAGLVNQSATPLRLLVAVALPLLVWSVVEVLRPAGDLPLDAVLGAFGLVVGAARLVGRPPPRPRSRSRRAGAHAA